MELFLSCLFTNHQLVFFLPSPHRAETNQSIAVTELFVHPDYRKRNVAESLVRAATIYYMRNAPNPKRQVVCLIPDSFDAATRVFARVGFRLGEQARLEQTLTGVSLSFTKNGMCCD